MFKEFIIFSFAGLPPGLISIAIISLVITFLQLLAYKKLSDQERIKEIKERQKQISKEIREVKDEKRLQALNKEMLSLSGELMRLSMWPSLITLLPLLLVLWLLRNVYTANGVGNIISWQANLPIVGNGAGWLLCFIVFTFVFNLVLRKIMKIY
jgi:uncharacterized membrane protein (DUF106 family)